MARNIKKEVKKLKEVSYTSKDFTSLRNDLRRYMQTHFSDSVLDFSDASLPGMLVDLGAYVGDVMTYYLDHQFNEISIETAVERENLERLIREAGIRIPAASPAYTEVDLTINVPASLINGEYLPVNNSLPTIKTNSIFSTADGTQFYLLEDVDFSEKDDDGKLIAEREIASITSSGVINNYFLTRKAIVSSAKIKTATFDIEDNLIPFRTLTLSEDNVNEIVSVVDSLGDNYYEVDSLSQDTVFRAIENSRVDKTETPFRMELMHAPKRFVTIRSINTGKTTLRFGSGNEDSFDEDVIPDPSEHAIRLFGDRKTFSNVTIDPNSFLTTQTLGISPKNTTLTITYRCGGGVNHNVSAGAINSINTLITNFQTSTPPSTESSVRASLQVINLKNATGGEDEPSLEEMRQIAIFNRSSQNRIVTREDLIARIYSMPAKFGRVFRASVSDNPRNPQAAQLHIISRNSKNKLTISSDTLKQNLAKYLNDFRIVSDSIDIMDSIIVNIGIDFSVTVEKGYRQDIVLSSLNEKIKELTKIQNQQINKPIIISEIENIILNTPGVVSLLSLNILGRSGIENGNAYNNYKFNVLQHLDRGMLFPPIGGIFEIKYPNDDIMGRAV